MRPIHRGNSEKWRAGVEIECCWFDVDVLQLRVSASNGLFAGVAYPYVDHESLREAANDLAGFPESASDVRELQFGASGMEFAGGFVRISFSCRDAAGHVALELLIESKNESHAQPTWHKGIQTVHFFVAVEPAAIDEFVQELHKLGESKTGSAMLATRSS